MFTTREGGLEQAFLDYTEALESCGEEVVLVLHTKTKILPSVRSKYYQIHNYSKYDLLALFRLKLLILKEKPDIIITHGNRAHYLLKKTAGKIPVVGISHGNGFEHIKNCDYIITVNREMRQQFIDLGYNSQNIAYIPNMIRLDNQPKVNELAIRKEPVIGVIARLDYIKGIDTFLQALSALKARGVNFKAKIAGDGPESEPLKMLTAKLGLTEQVEFLGWIEDKAGFYNSIDIVCMPSRYESFGIVILEAFKYMKALVVSNSAGPSQLINHGENGLIFPVEDSAMLADYLQQVINDKDLAKSLAHNAFDSAKLYDIKFVGKKIVELLRFWKNEYRKQVDKR